MAYSFDFPIKHLYPDHDAGIPVAVFLSYGGKTEKVSAKLDTGADFCVFTHDVAMQLGVPLDTGLKKTFDTSGGLIDAYGHEVTINSFGHEHTAIVFFAAAPGHRRNLLGRQGWIRNFGIALFDYDSTLYLRPIS
ncbi:MAG: aspartyl protease family protein [Blastocatellales bacterium]